MSARNRKHQLTNEQKGVIIGLSEAGHSQREIVDIVKEMSICVSKSGVQRIISLHKAGQSVSRRKGSGGRHKLNKRDVRALKHRVLMKHKTTFTDLSREFTSSAGEKVSRYTISRYLRKEGFKSCRCRKVPRLTKKHKAARLSWAKEHQNEDWSKIIWSDESRFSLSSDRPESCIRRSGEQFHQQCIKSTVKGNPGIMVWGCFTAEGVGRLHRIQRGVKINAAEYKKILEESLLPTISDLPHSRSFKFQQDNAPCHKAASITAWLRQKKIKILDNWPAQSPDLNPIENIWDYIDKEIHKHPIRNLEELWTAINGVWSQIPAEFINNLIESMPRRLKAVLDNKGSNTKY